MLHLTLFDHHHDLSRSSFFVLRYQEGGTVLLLRHCQPDPVTISATPYRNTSDRPRYDLTTNFPDFFDAVPEKTAPAFYDSFESTSPTTYIHCDAVRLSRRPNFSRPAQSLKQVSCAMSSLLQLSAAAAAATKRIRTKEPFPCISSFRAWPD